MISPALPAGASAAASRSFQAASSPRSGASASRAHCSTTPPLLIAPPTTHRPGVSA